MFRTFKYVFKKPWGLYKFITEPRKVFWIIKAVVVSNWYLDIKHNNKITPKYKKKLMWFMDAKMDERYERDEE